MESVDAISCDCFVISRLRLFCDISQMGDIVGSFESGNLFDLTKKLGLERLNAY